MKRYSIVLLFEYDLPAARKKGESVYTEIRLVTFKARSASEALRKAKQQAEKREYKFRNSDNDKYYFKFVGVIELICLDPECEKNEVWYDIRIRRRTDQSFKQRFIPAERDLDAIRQYNGVPGRKSFDNTPCAIH